MGYTPNPTVKMSTYRSPYKRNTWRDRDAERRDAERKAEEDQRKKNVMNETNFPSLSIAHPISEREVASGNQFAQLAEKWSVDAEVDRRIEQHKKFQAALARQETEYTDDQIEQHRKFQAGRHETQRGSMRNTYEQSEYDDEELAPLPQSATQQIYRLEDDAGWTEVRHKTYKPKRELTIEEMDELERRMTTEVAHDDFNGHLLDSNRHDHDRV